MRLAVRSRPDIHPQQIAQTTLARPAGRLIWIKLMGFPEAQTLHSRESTWAVSGCRIGPYPMMGLPMTLIRAEHLVKTHRTGELDVAAIKGIDFTIEAKS